MVRMTDRAWAPWVSGVLIGLLQIPAFILIGTALGTSSSYVTLSATVAGWVDPGVGAIDYAAKHLSGAKNWWQVAMVLGIALGAALSASLSGARRRGVAPVWDKLLAAKSGGSTGPKRFLLAFCAGFLMLAGARIADGCTSGHGLSGIAQLAIGSFIAVAAMFAGGIATAMLLRRVR